MAFQCTCEVTAAGAAAPPADTGVYIRLRDTGGAFDDRWFVAPEVKSREMLATALSALAIGLHVWTELESTNEYSSIHTLYVTKSA